MFRLSSKIMLAFSIIILTGTVLMVSIINQTTRTGYETFVKDNDKKMAKSIEPLFTEYYSLNKSWNGIDKYLLSAKTKTVFTSEGNKRRGTVLPPVILTDKNKSILLNTLNNKSVTRIKLTENGIPIKYDNKIIAYIYVGSMIEKGLSIEEELFLKKINTIIILVSLLILTISIIFTYFFSNKITRPISDLSKAAKDIETGDYKIRVKTQGKDEISNLSLSFNRMAESIEGNDIWRKKIIADSAHELRTPVTLIQGNLEMILDGIYKPDKDNIQGIYNETLVLSRLIKELQELSSAESESLNMTKTDININDLLNNCLEIFRPESIKNNITFTSEINNPNVKIKGDLPKLKQVLTNILSNGFRYTPNGGSIEIKTIADKTSINISIKDSGSGIANDELKKVFERFYRTDNSRNRISGGSGLGLAISKEIIKRHNGTIHAESKIGFGTKIIISLPINS